MNRTHLEGAAEALAAQQGYAFHTGPEDGMAHTMRSYPMTFTPFCAMTAMNLL